MKEILENIDVYDIGIVKSCNIRNFMFQEVVYDTETKSITVELTNSETSHFYIMENYIPYEFHTETSFKLWARIINVWKKYTQECVQ